MMLRPVSFLLLALLRSLVVVQAQDNCAASLPALPADVAAAKAEIIRLSLENTNLWGDDEIQVLIDAQAAILEEWYVNNRPDNEFELTLGGWRAIWYEDDRFASRGNFFFASDRTNSFQVVRDGFYYNIGRLLYFGGLFVQTNFLKGEYTIVDPKMDDTCGQPRRNVIDLEFTSNRLAFGWLPQSDSLVTIIDEVDAGTRPGGFSIPGPIGVTGSLWNQFVDEDLRVAFGSNDEGDIVGLFVLIRQEFVTS